MINEKENEDMKEMERKPYSSESMRVRCPHCRKLYLVQFNDVREAKPRFECVQCRDRFWLSLPDMDLSAEMMGIPMQLKEAPPKAKRESESAESREVEPCPKCFKPVQVGTAECPNCGVFVGRLKSLTFQENEAGQSPALAAAWKKVLANYPTDEVHAEFLRLAQQEQNLPFAASRYGQMQKLMPTDETTLRRVREVQALAAMLVPEVEPRTPRRWFMGRVWQIPLVISVLMMVAGMLLPVMRNMVGVGAAIFFVSLVVQLQMRPRDRA